MRASAGRTIAWRASAKERLPESTTGCSLCRYNSRVTCECCEAVLRVLLGSSPPATSPTLLAPSVEPTLRSVLAHNAPHWSGLRYSEKAVQDFFAEAARVGSAPRVSKRQRTAPAFADEERANPRAAEQQKLAEKRAVREAARGAAEEERAESAAALARAEREVKAARRRCREAEEGLQVRRRGGRHDTSATRPRHAHDTPTTRPRHVHDTSTTRPRHADDTSTTRP